jgi:hypothetical protein
MYKGDGDIGAEPQPIRRERNLKQRQKRIAAGLEAPQGAETHAFQAPRLVGDFGERETTKGGIYVHGKDSRSTRLLTDCTGAQFQRNRVQMQFYAAADTADREGSVPRRDCAFQERLL